MALMSKTKIESIPRVPNFSRKVVPRCMNCGQHIDKPVGIYSRRFCSIDCMNSYLL